MPNLRSILCLINSAVQTGAFSQFPAGKWHTIAYSVPTSEDGEITEQPAIVDEFGESKRVAIDDNYPLQVYHKLDELRYDIPKDDVNAPGTFMAEQASLRLIFIGDRSKLKVEQEDIVAMVIYYIPKEFLPAQINPLGLSTVQLSVDALNLNPQEVWSREVKGTPFTLKPSTILFSLSYKIITTYSAKCFNLCSTSQTINQ